MFRGQVVKNPLKNPKGPKQVVSCFKSAGYFVTIINYSIQKITFLTKLTQQWEWVTEGS